jgi:doubled CXXCH motif protein
MRAVVLLWALSWAGCTADIGATGLGADAESDETCVSAGCHVAVAEAMAPGSSHAVLLRCRDCHEVVRLDATPGHARSAACEGCHSQRGHEGVACTVCHSPHGTSNAFLLRETVAIDADRVALVRVARPEGASWSGLARAGVPGAKAGTGFCEVCHQHTRFYDRDGTGAPHDGAWCESCHLHDDGFAAGMEKDPAD